MCCLLTTRAGPADGDNDIQLVTVNSDVGVQVGNSRAASSPDASKSEFAHFVVVYPGGYGASGASMQVMGQADIWRRLRFPPFIWWRPCGGYIVPTNLSHQICLPGVRPQMDYPCTERA